MSYPWAAHHPPSAWPSSPCKDQLFSSRGVGKGTAFMFEPLFLLHLFPSRFSYSLYSSPASNNSFVSTAALIIFLRASHFLGTIRVGCFYSCNLEQPGIIRQKSLITEVTRTDSFSFFICSWLQTPRSQASPFPVTLYNTSLKCWF